MPIRKGKLHRICSRCEKTFEPHGKEHRICDKCNKKATKLGRVKFRLNIKKRITKKYLKN